MYRKWMGRLGLLVTVIVSGSANASVKTLDWRNGSMGEKAKLITLESSSLRVRLTNDGAQIVSVDAPDKNGNKLIAIGKRIGADDTQLKRADGYDHNWVLSGRIVVLHAVAFAEDPVSGRTLTVFTTEPGVLFGKLSEWIGEGLLGHDLSSACGFCLETQHFPDSPNHASFPSAILEQGETFHSHTALIFGVSSGAK